MALPDLPPTAVAMPESLRNPKPESAPSKLSPDDVARLAEMPESDEVEAARWCRGHFSRRAALKLGDYPSRTHWEFMQYAESDPKWLFDQRWFKNPEKGKGDDDEIEIDAEAVEQFDAAVAAGKARMA